MDSEPLEVIDDAQVIARAARVTALRDVPWYAEMIGRRCKWSRLRQPLQQVFREFYRPLAAESGLNAFGAIQVIG